MSNSISFDGSNDSIDTPIAWSDPNYKPQHAYGWYRALTPIEIQAIYEHSENAPKPDIIFDL